VPLLFHRGRYREVDPDTGARTPVDKAGAGAFGRIATQVQVPLPARAGPADLLRLGLRGTGGDLWGLLSSGLLVAVLSLATPLVSGLVLGALAREGTFSGIGGVALLFLAGAVVTAMLAVAQNLRLLRIEGRLENAAQTAVWDRLIRLPVRFFRAHPSGELANAVLGISFTREVLSGILTQAVPAAFAAVTILGLLFATSTPIGLYGVAVTACLAGFTWACGALVVRRQRQALPVEHRTAALANQLLGGISKIKLARAEDRAYARWADGNTAARTALQRVRQVQATIMAVASAVPVAGQLILLVLLAGPLRGGLSVTAFFLVNVAFMLLLGSLLVLVSAGVEVLAALPRLTALDLVLDVQPERPAHRIDPGELRGEIELNQVTFGYHADDPPVLQDVSLRVSSGEFVAIVGPSGCGKSTLLRLLLGFEHPDSGSVLYDGQDLAELDVHAVRRQCGVVLQDGRLFAGTIRENICGTGDFTLDEVWAAAAMAGLDEDVNRLPMGMATMVPFGGGTLSVGQRQRILIARALIHRPRVLLFDEATSALDNRTQEVVTASTQQLAASRVVIAHRLSTVRNADTVVVMDRGRVVQQGSFDALLTDRDGLFHQLARRQLLTGPADDTNSFR
jgi:NHLM bacteriocin system ABC transporter ATP-binding protein